MLQAVVGRPGPSSVALVRLARQLYPATGLAPALRFTSTTTAGPRPNGQKPFQEVPSQLAKPAKAKPQKRHPTPLVTHDEHATVLSAPAPLSGIDIQKAVLKFRNRINSSDLNGVAKSWGVIVHLRGIEAVPDEVFELASDFVHKATSGMGQIDVGLLAHHNPEQYDLLRDMCIEAAAREHWQGLFAFQLQLLAADRPNDVAKIYPALQTRTRVLQNKSEAGLLSAWRADRVAARLDNEGLTHLALSQLAALTMLNQVDSLTFGPLFGSHKLSKSWRSTSLPLIRQALMRNANHVKAFDRHVSHLNVAMLCYHPSALATRVNSLAITEDWKRIRDLYNAIMLGSIGPDRYITPQDRHSTRLPGTTYHIASNAISLTWPMWIMFMRAFSLQRNDKMIMTMFNDIAARHNSIPMLVFCIAMQQLGFIATGKKKDGEDTARLLKTIEAFWDHAISLGALKDPAAVGRRINVLAGLGRIDEAMGEYHRARVSFAQAGVNDPEGHIQREYLITMFRASQWTEAMAFLDYGPKMSAYSYQMVLGAVLRSTASLQVRRTFWQRLMKGATGSIYDRTWGLILDFLLEGGNNVKRSCDYVMAAQHSSWGLWYAGVFSSLLIQRGSPVTVAHFKAAVYMLEHIVADETFTTKFHYTAPWRVVLSAISQTPVFSQSDRHHWIERILRSCPQQPPPDELYWAIMRGSLKCPNGEGVPEALHSWEKFEGRERCEDFETLMEGLVRHGYPTEAREVAALIPFGNKFSEARETAKEFGFETGIRRVQHDSTVDDLAGEPDLAEDEVALDEADDKQLQRAEAEADLQ